jgi:hypothetical protein
LRAKLRLPPVVDVFTIDKSTNSVVLGRLAVRGDPATAIGGPSE